jgi:hypothetical protein
MSLGVSFIDVAWFGVIVLMAMIWVVLDVDHLAHQFLGGHARFTQPGRS